MYRHYLESVHKVALKGFVSQTSRGDKTFKNKILCVPGCIKSGQQPVYNFSMYIGQSVPPTLVFESELFMLNA